MGDHSARARRDQPENYRGGHLDNGTVAPIPWVKWVRGERRETNWDRLHSARRRATLARFQHAHCRRRTP